MSYHDWCGEPQRMITQERHNEGSGTMTDEEFERDCEYCAAHVDAQSCRAAARIIADRNALKAEVERLTTLLTTHAPEGHNVTNAEYVAVLSRLEAAEKVCEWVFKYHLAEWEATREGIGG